MEPITGTQAQATDEQGTPTWVIVVCVLAAAVVLAGGQTYWLMPSRS